MAFRLTGPLDESAFAAAFGDLLERHEILRTVCREHDGLAYQHVEQVSAEQLPLRVVTCRDGELAQAVHEASRRPFDLEKELPVTAWLFRSGPAERVLLLVLHHLVCDGWSLRPLLEDLSTAYRARTGGGAAPQWDPLPVQYGDYTVWQRELLGQESDADSLMARQLTHWETALAGLPDEFDLPADRVRPPVASNQGGRVPFEVPADVCTGLANLAGEENATLFMVLQAAVAALLSRLGCGTDIAVGTSVAGRVDEALDGLVGFFVNTLVLRTDVAGDPDFRTLVRRARRTCIDAYAHQDVPFDRVVERLNPSRSLARNPLYQVAVEVHAGGDEGLSLASVRCAAYELVLDTVKSDLAFTFTETVDASGRPVLAGELGYAKDLFDRETVEEIGLWLGRLLADIAADPGRRVGAVALLSGQERKALLEGDARPIQPGAEAGVVERVRDWAARQPDAVAVVDDHGSTSYGLLAGRASRIARRLMDTGVRRGQVVAVLAERNANVIEAFLGIGTAGAVYLPLDPEAPPARTAGLLADAGAVCVVTDQAHTALADEVMHLAGGGIDALVIDGGADEPDQWVPVVGGQDDIAYVIFTSGSTGRPKGALVYRRGMVNNLLCEAEAMNVTGPETVALTAPLTFDISVWQMFVGLIFGGTVRVVPTTVARDPQALFDLVRRDAVSVLQLVPSMLQAVLEEWDAGGPPADLPLKVLAVTGEALPATLCGRWFARFEQIPLVNCYGPTECSDDVTHARITARELPTGARVPIGRAVRGSRLYVLDERLEPVPGGVAGELYIGGAVVGAGYLRDPARTAGAFVADRFGAPGTRMYRTGDLVRRRRDGRLEFLGRRDHQVKIRGQRIELDEVEHAVRQLDGVKDAVVTAVADPSGNLRLVGYVTGDADPAALRGELAAVLPAAMIPSAIVAMSSFPQTPNGKLDRKALPRPVFERPTGRAPRTPVERALCDVFSQVLGVGDVGIDDNFFELGGHSLLATRLVRRISDRLGVQVPLMAAFGNATPARLAAVIEASDSPELPEGLELSADAVLDDLDITGSAPVDPARSTDPQSILLTGATGFLGAFLLRELLERTRARVYCLVRASDEAAALDRIRQAFKTYRISLDLDRVIAVPGDLGRPLLGLTPSRFDEMAARVDVVYHNGARVNMADSYAQAKPANVDGTREVLRLAARHRVVPVHYVSTTGTVRPGPDGPEVLPEEWVTAPERMGTGGYECTKWVAEQLVRQAGKSGIPVAVYRPGRIVGDSVSGATGSDDAFWHYVRACVAVRAVPDSAWEGLADYLAPVDFVAAAVVALARTQVPDGTTYHVLGPLLTVRDVVAKARTIGYPVDELSYAAWNERLQHVAAVGEARRGDPVQVTALFEQAITGRGHSRPLRYATVNTDRALAGTTVRCPAVDDELLHRYYRFLAESDLLPGRTCEVAAG